MKSTVEEFYVSFVFLTVYLILPWSAIILPVYGLFTRFWWVSVLVVGAYAPSYFDGCEKTVGRPWRAFSESVLFKPLFSYFNMNLVTEFTENLDPRQKYIFAVHPHGMLAFSRIIFGFNKTNFWDKKFPNIKRRDLSASVSFKIPCYREIWLWSDCVDASKSTVEKLLNDGTSVLLYPGGEMEQLLSREGEYRIYLSNRKGFVKLALRYGTPLLPCFCFGENRMYKTFDWILPDFRKWFVKKFRIPLFFFCGRFWIFPRKCDITVVVGKPINLPLIPNPSEDDVNLWHKKYVEALCDVFERNKGKYGDEKKNIEIL